MVNKTEIREIFKSEGAERISGDVIDEVDARLRVVAEDIAAESIKFAKHANRKTVQLKDVLEAVD